MLFKRNYKTAAATFVVAITTGFVMQNGDALAARFATSAPQGQPAQDELVKTVQTLSDEAATPPVKQSVLADQSEFADRVKRTEQDYTAPKISSDQEYSALGLTCDISLEARKSAGAMVTLYFKAPCHANEIVRVRHQGLLFTAVTSDIGHFTARIPAFAEIAAFKVELVNGSSVSTSLVIPDVSDYDRVAVQWTGDSGLRIHALEMGADYGERGHVWAKSPQSVARSLQAQGGYITELGNADYPAAKHIEIYSFPTGQMQKTGVVRLSVEVEVTARNCNREIVAQALQSGVAGGISTVDLTLTMPTCDAIGDFLVLNNLLRDLKIAQN